MICWSIIKMLDGRCAATGDEYRLWWGLLWSKVGGRLPGFLHTLRNRLNNSSFATQPLCVAVILTLFGMFNWRETRGPSWPLRSLNIMYRQGTFGHLHKHRRQMCIRFSSVSILIHCLIVWSMLQTFYPTLPYLHLQFLCLIVLYFIVN